MLSAFLRAIRIAFYAAPFVVFGSGTVYAQGNAPLPSLPPPSSSSPSSSPAVSPPPPPPSATTPAPQPLPELPPPPATTTPDVAPATPSTAASSPPPATVEPAERRKTLGVGLDLQVLVPVGTLGDATGVMLGPVARGGLRATARLELTFRAGFLFGLNHEQSPTYSTSLTLIPLWLGARYFVLHDTHGLYGAVEAGVNLLQLHQHTDVDLGSEASKLDAVRARGGFDVGVGYVLSEALPIDFRVQYTYLNVVGTQTGDDPFMGVGLSVGYTLAF